RRPWRCCARWPRPPAGCCPGPRCCPRCPAAPTSTRWRWRWPGCAPRWAAPRTCRPWSSAATGCGWTDQGTRPGTRLLDAQRLDGVLHHADQYRLDRLAFPRVAQRERHLRPDGQRLAYLVGGVPGCVVEAVHRHQVGQVPALEEVDRGEAV